MEKNTKNIIIIAVIVIVAAGAFFAGGTLKKHKRSVRGDEIGGGMEKALRNVEGVPDGLPSVTGQFIAVDGNQIIIESIVRDGSEENRGEVKNKMQSLSDGGRQQMRESRMSERETAEKEKIFVTIGDTKKVIKKSETADVQEIGVEDLQEGDNIMVWKDGVNAIFILQNSMNKNNNF